MAETERKRINHLLNDEPRHRTVKGEETALREGRG